MTPSPNVIDSRFGGGLLDRVMPIRVVDIILALYQTTFSMDDLIDGKNPLRFNRDDQKNSRLWICEPEGRIDTERDGRRMLVAVSRGDLSPAEAHMHNFAGGNMHGTQEFSDLVSVPILVQCEAGSRTSVEVLAHACYSIVKLFRRQLLAEYGITNLKVLGISPPSRTDGIPGDPWLCTVMLRCEYQERATVTQMSNHLNYVNIHAVMEKTLSSPPPPEWSVTQAAVVPHSSQLLDRVMPVRTVDIVLALLQGAFGQDNLMGDTNLLRFNRNDPKNSRLWICDPEGRIDTPRDGRRSMVTVTRGDLSPAENHQHNFAGGNLHGTTEFTDLVSVPILILCEAGSQVMVEVLAHACYMVVKAFRWQLLAEYGITNITVMSLGAPVRTDGIPGDPWFCTVAVRFDYQERALMTVDANALNYVNIRASMDKHLAPPEPMNVRATATQGTLLVTGELTDWGTEFTVQLVSVFFEGQSQRQTTTLEFVTDTLGAEIYYVEGSRDPTMHDIRYTGPILITEPGRHYFAVRAFKVGLLPSPTLRVSYDLKP